MAFEDGVFATFYDKAVENKRESKAKGYPVFNEVLYIKIVVPNQVDVVPRPAQDKDKERFPKSWQAYLTGKEPVDDGFPVEEWTQLTMSELKVLQAVNIKTVEQLADTPDSGIHRLGPGGMGMKTKAQKFLDSRTEVDDLRKEIEDLKKQLAEKPTRKRLKVAK